MLYINLSLYLILFIYYIRKKIGIINLFPFSIWTTGAICAIFYSNSHLYYGLKDFSLFPFLYLFLLFFIFFQGIKVDKIEKVETCKSPFIIPLIVIIAISAYLPFFEMVLNMLNGGVDFANIADVKDAYYAGDIDPRKVFSSIGSKFYSISMYTMFVTPIFFFYYIIKVQRTRKYIILGLILAILNPILFNISIGGRGVLIWVMMYFTLIYFFFMNLIPRTYNRFIKKSLIVVIVIVVAIFILMTILRFSSDKYSDYLISEWLFRYFGESFCNFDIECWNFKGITRGQNCFSFFSSIVGGDGQRNYIKLEQITGTRMNVYNTMFGDLLYDVGYYAVPLVTVGLYYLSIYFKPKDGIIRLYSFLIFSIFSYMFLSGLFIWPLINRPYPFITSVVLALLLYLSSLQKSSVVLKK